MRSRSISYVSAAVSSLPAMRVRDLISLGRIPHTGWTGRMGEEDRAQVELAASKLELLPYMDRQVDMLSDGEKQRVMIARALVQDTPVMILDEPAAYLDIPHRYELLHILGTLRDEGKCILFSTHDLEMAMNSADKFWIIAGRKVHEGAPEDLGMAGVFDQLFQDSGIAFDLEKGRFRSRRSARGRICLKAESGALRQWTSLALERIGYEITAEEAPLEVWLEQQHETPRWICLRNGRRFEFSALYTLSRFLTREE
jgi:iron complex transport system ATP-binding protein